MSKLMKLWLLLIIRVDYATGRLSNWWFEVRLQRACRKYGGGQHIPPDVVGKLLGNTGDDCSFVFTVQVTRVCERLGIDPITTEFFSRVRWMVAGTMPTLDQKMYGLGLLDEMADTTPEYGRAIILRELMACGDMSWGYINEHFPEETNRRALLDYLGIE